MVVTRKYPRAKRIPVFVELVRDMTIAAMLIAAIGLSSIMLIFGA